MKITLDITPVEISSIRRVISAERRGDSYGEKDAVTRDRVMRRLVVEQVSASGRLSTAPSGSCVGCGCTETDPCNPPCHWINRFGTLCNACAEA